MGSSTSFSGKVISISEWKVVAILSSIATMVMYAETMLVPAIPDLINDFNIPYSTSSWILTTYLITAAVMTPIAGKLSDIYGKKKIAYHNDILHCWSFHCRILNKHRLYANCKRISRSGIVNVSHCI